MCFVLLVYRSTYREYLARNIAKTSTRVHKKSNASILFAYIPKFSKDWRCQGENN